LQHTSSLANVVYEDVKGGSAEAAASIKRLDVQKPDDKGNIGSFKHPARIFVEEVVIDLLIVVVIVDVVGPSIDGIGIRDRDSHGGSWIVDGEVGKRTLLDRL
jgi:hypothetical protein